MRSTDTTIAPSARPAPAEGARRGGKPPTIIEWDTKVRSVLVVAVPMADGPAQLANCFAEAARLIRKHGLVVRGVQLTDVPEGLLLFCDEDGA